MSRFDRIAIANVGWSELYEGDALVGDHAFLQNNGWGAERYNFVRDVKGRFSVYVRPVGPYEAAPSPGDKDGWLIVFVSKRQGKPGLYIVGWFEDATFLPGYLDLHEYELEEDFPLTPDGTKFHYDVSAQRGVRVPEDLRDVRIQTTAMRRTSIMYLRGHGKTTAAKEELAKSILRQIEQLRESIAAAQRHSGSVENDSSRSPISTDSSRRKEVEERSMEIATAHFEKQGYSVKDVSKSKREFCDLVATKDERRLSIEVKGTQSDRPQFLMSRRERRFMEDPINLGSWRLLIVTSALQKPKILELSVEEVLKRFELTTFTWFGEEKL